MDGQEGIYIRPGFTIPNGELHFSFTASSGPGGQKVNKTATKVRMKWWPLQSAALLSSLTPQEQDRFSKKVQKILAEDGSIQVVSDRFRSRDANQNDCRHRLASQVRTWLKKPKKRIPTRPTRTSREKRLEDKKRTARIKKNRKSPPEE